jgi:hypothetical protein
MGDKDSRKPTYIMMPDGTVRDISDDAPRLFSLLKGSSSDASGFLEALDETIEELERAIVEEMAQEEEDEHDEESG